MLTPVACDSVRWNFQIISTDNGGWACQHIPIRFFTFVDEPLDRVEFRLEPGKVRIEEQKGVKSNFRDGSEVGF
jgi:hypothetical protein